MAGLETQGVALPYLTAELGGIGGSIKQACEDFVVEEIPLYPPAGSGSHVYFRLVKTGIPTPAAVDRIARYMGVSPREIGFAGLKDAQAVTGQMMSLEHADEEKLAAYSDAQMRVVWTARHGNKLRAGHLAGNRFDIRIRDVAAERLDDARRILDALIGRGAPNYFGPQRFGARGDTADLGEALLRDDLEGFVSILLGRPKPTDPPDCRAARGAFDEGDFDAALKHWPRHYANERRVLSAFSKRKHAGRAIAAVDKRMIRLYVSAFQSLLFNEVLAQRIQAVDKVFVGDLAQKSDTGGIFVVEDESVEQPRAARFEISPTGPIVGYRCNLAQGSPGAIEQDVLADHGIDMDKLRRVGTLKIKGTRRALRFKIEQPELSAGSDDRGPYIQICFTAPTGCYATSVLREITKSD